jgi:uncharacterized protein (DUF2062 family)
MRSRLLALWTTLRDEHSTPGQLAVAMFVGLFVGIVPFYGLQIPICLLLVAVFPLNRLVVFGAVQVSNPFFAPFLLAAGVWLGDRIRYGRFHTLDLATRPDPFSGADAWDVYLSCLLGDTLLALVVGAAGAGATYVWRARALRPRATGATSARPGGDVLGDRAE